MMQGLRRFIMTRKNVLDCVLESSLIVQEFTKKSLLKQAVQKKIMDFFLRRKRKFVSLSFFNVFQCNEISL
jgi:hypothetical protein